MRAFVFFVLMAAVTVTGFAAPEAKPELKLVKTGPLTETDKDGYILFTYSLADGLEVQDGKEDRTIKLAEGKGGTTFVFEKHVLSCGTVMTGRIVMSQKGSMTRYTGEFAVSNNSFKIDALTGDYGRDSASGKRNGFLVVNDRKIDITLF